MAWQDKVAEKRKAAAKLVPSTWKLPESTWASLSMPLEANPNRLNKNKIARQSGILSSKELEITEGYDTAGLLAVLARGQLSAVEVTTAFCKRAALAQQLTNCLTEVFYDTALSRAKYLDDYLASNGEPLGPLHGLPISMKDSFKVQGYDSSIGFVSLLNQPAQKNSALVDVLLDLGAVLYVKTNIPQTMMTADSHNNVWGRTLNPHNTALTAGGSTGGEGALIAFRGSPLGVGTDIAGSIRIPSLCCGIYGFKPTSGRIPFGGQQSPALEGFAPIAPVAGPMANSFSALRIFTEAVLSADPARYDSDCFDIPWDPLPLVSSTASNLNIGVIEEDPAMPFHPPVKRALDQACRLLGETGHTIIPISAKLARVAQLAEISMALFSLDISDGVALMTSSGEPPVPSVAKNTTPLLTEDLASLRRDLEGMDMFHKIAALLRKRRELCEAWRKLWIDLGLDAVICPGAQTTAVKHDTYPYPAYTVFLNVLDVSQTLSKATFQI